MRKVFTLLFMTYAIMVCSQVTISEAAAPVPGEIWTEYYPDNIPSNFTLGASGPAQNWDYSNLMSTFEGADLHFQDPSALTGDFATAFPNADLAIFFGDDTGNGDDGAQYFKTSSDGLYIDGLRFEYGLDIELEDFDPDQLLVPLDFTYQDEVTDMTFSEQFIEYNGAMLWYKSYGIKSFEGDGYGTLSTPGGTFSDVIRCKILEYTVDSIFIDSDNSGNYSFLSTEGPLDSLVTYFHLQNQAPMLLCSITIDPTTGQLDDMSYQVLGTVSVAENTPISFDLYPNPTTGLLKVVLDSPSDYQITVFNIEGRPVIEAFINEGNNQNQVDLSSLQSGIYTLRILSPVGVGSKRIILE